MIDYLAPLFAMRKLAVIGILILLAIGFTIKTFIDAGEFRTLKPHFDGTVRQISGIFGDEDITIDYEQQIAFISADDRYKTLHGQKAFGGIYILDLKNPGALPYLVSLNPNEEIHPHGISLYKSPQGATYLYVIDHKGDKSVIHLLSYPGAGTLSLVKTFDDERFIIS